MTIFLDKQNETHSHAHYKLQTIDQNKIVSKYNCSIKHNSAFFNLSRVLLNEIYTR